MVASLQLQKESVRDMVKWVEPIPSLTTLGTPRFFLVEEDGRKIELYILGIIPETRTLLLGVHSVGKRLTNREIGECLYIGLNVCLGQRPYNEKVNPGVTYDCVEFLSVIEAKLTRITEEKETTVLVGRTGKRCEPYARTMLSFT